jgi:hypothetical protein
MGIGLNPCTVFVKLLRLNIEICWVWGFEVGSVGIGGAVEGGGGKGTFNGLSFKILPDLRLASGDMSIPNSLSLLALNGSA